MKFKPRIIKRFKPRIILATLLALIISFSMLQPTLTVYADSGNGESDNAGSATGNHSGGPSAAKTGWILYCLNDKGTHLTNAIAFTSTGNTPDTSGYTYIRTRSGLKPKLDPDMTPAWNPATPYGTDGKGHGKTIIDWMLQKGDNGHSNASAVMDSLWGKGFYENVFRKDPNNHLVIEPFYWFKYNGQSVCATAFGWGQFLSGKTGANGYGDSTYRRYTNELFAHCAKFDHPQFGIPNYPNGGKVTNSQLMEYGLGIMTVTPENNLVHTYNGVDSPGPAAKAPKGFANIVKSYYTINRKTSIKTDDGTYSMKDVSSKISIDSEPEYTVKEWASSTTTNEGISSLDWNPPSTIFQTGEDPTVIELGPAENCLYVLLEKVEDEEEDEQDYHYKLNQSQITRRIHLSKPDNPLPVNISDYAFKWAISEHKAECPGHKCGGCECSGHSGSHNSNCPPDCTRSHSYTCGGCECPGHKCGGWKWKDQSLRWSLSNTEKDKYPDVLSQKEEWRHETSKGGLTKFYRYTTRDNTSALTYTSSNWDLVCVIMRGKDQLTLAEWKNNSLAPKASELKDASSSGFKSANTDQGTRKFADYYDKFSIKMENDLEGTDRNTVYGSSTNADKANVQCGNNERWLNLTNPLTINNITVKIETYSGSPSGGYTDTTCNTDKMVGNLGLSGYNTTSGVMVPSGGTISFRPYIEMRWDSLTSLNQKAYVLGEYTRAISPNDYAEISWNKTSGENLTLSSLQWSTHAQATKNWGSGVVLPGGATMSLGIKKGDQQEILVSSYQTILVGAGKEQAEYLGAVSGFDEETAISNHQSLVDSVVSGLDSLNVQQYVDKNSGASNAWSSGIKVGPEAEIGALGNGSSNASYEDKYYFRGDGYTNSGAGEGDLDATAIGTDKTIYTFFSNTKGEIRMTTNNTSPKENDGALVCSKGSDNISDSIAKLLDDRTYVVRKLVKSLERDTGNDPEAKNVGDGHWYNEAFDGVSVIVQRTKIKVGYIDPSERTSVLDPRLIPKNVGQSDLFSKYFLSQFKMKEYTDVYGDDYKIGEFKGSSLYMKDMDMLYWSKKFYIPNVTTQDLH